MSQPRVPPRIHNDSGSTSPFLTGLLRFSPNNQSGFRFSPHSATSKAKPQFFPSSDSNIPLDQLRALSKDCTEQAVWFASIVYAKTQSPTDALLLAEAQLKVQNHAGCLKTLDASALLSSPPQQQDTENQHYWEALLLACAALAATDEYTVLQEVLDDACRWNSVMLEDDDESGWQRLAQTITPKMTSIHPLAQILYWRGIAINESGHPQRAASMYKLALQIDPLCQAAYNKLMDRQLISSKEAYKFVLSLDFGTTHGWLRALYLAQIEPPKEDLNDVDQALEELYTVYKLGDAPYVQQLAANAAYRRFDWKAALEHCQELTEPSITYVSALVLTGQVRELFRVAHEYVTMAPKSAYAWYAVGAYYYACGRHHVAQRHFCRATRLDPQCTEAWIAFGCSFSAVDESDQALACFRAAQRLSPGEHLSLCYMGMEYVRTNHLTLAQYFLTASLNLSQDPLCLHENGVLALQKGDFGKAVDWFTSALRSLYMADLDECLELCQDVFWEPTVFNLGHSFRKLRQFDKAALCYGRCVALCSKHSTHAALGFCLHLMQKTDEAIEQYHKALSCKPEDPFSTEMLNRALRELVSKGFDENEEPFRLGSTSQSLNFSSMKDDSMMSEDMESDVDMSAG